jgi:putative PIN family toxin of toxin-antitoxin system
LLITSPAIMSEISAVLYSLWRGKKYHLTREDVAELTRLLEQDALVVPAQVNVRGAIPDDPSDEMFLACAVDAAANFIVTGDKHLLDLKTCRGIPIVTVQQFAEHLKSLTTL